MALPFEMQSYMIDLSRLFGEYLVEQRAIDRFQLFRALQLQDRTPGTRLGQCAVTLGFARPRAIEELHVRFELESMATQGFDREPEIEII